MLPAQEYARQPALIVCTNLVKMYRVGTLEVLALQGLI